MYVEVFVARVTDSVLEGRAMETFGVVEDKPDKIEETVSFKLPVDGGVAEGLTEDKLSDVIGTLSIKLWVDAKCDRDSVVVPSEKVPDCVVITDTTEIVLGIVDEGVDDVEDLLKS